MKEKLLTLGLNVLAESGEASETVKNSAEKVNDFFNKPGVTAAVSIVTTVVACVLLYRFVLRPILQKTIGNR